MKKCVLLTIVCCASMAFATTYDLTSDWVDYPGEPAAWDFGSKLQSDFGTGEFGAFSPMIHLESTWTGPPDGDGWAGPESEPHYTLSIWKNDPWHGQKNAMNVWDNYSPTVRVTPDADTYNVVGHFMGIGYAAAPGPTDVWVVKNDTDLLASGQIWAFTELVSFDLPGVAMNGTDYIDFIASNMLGLPECRVALEATLIPEPATMSLLGLGMLALLRRKR